MEYKSACETFLLMDSVPQTVSEQIKMEWVKTRISLHADTIPFFYAGGLEGQCRTARISNSSMFTLAALQSHYTGPSHLPDTSGHDIYALNRNFIVLSVCLPGGHVVRPWEKRMNYGSKGFVSAWRKMDRGR